MEYKTIKTSLHYTLGQNEVKARIIYKSFRCMNLNIEGKAITNKHIIKQNREDVEELEQYQELMKIL
ncbi:hypothetical protein AAK964_12275 [Tissierella praeacuta]|uniref:hypothetical protein n=1 Tax=Tissierella praeacuta TaxID=43131 RepID=UPI003516213F